MGRSSCRAAPTAGIALPPAPSAAPSNGIRTEAYNPRTIGPELLDELTSVLRAGYGPCWLGDAHFHQVCMRRATQVVVVHGAGGVEGCTILEGDRITYVAISPSGRGRGRSKLLLRATARTCPGVWITVHDGAESVIAALTSGGVGFEPVHDPALIKARFRARTGSSASDGLRLRSAPHPFLSARLERLGELHESFTLFSRAQSVHGGDYWQLLFAHCA